MYSRSSSAASIWNSRSPVRKDPPLDHARKDRYDAGSGRVGNFQKPGSGPFSARTAASSPSSSGADTDAETAGSRSAASGGLRSAWSKTAAQSVGVMATPRVGGDRTGLLRRSEADLFADGLGKPFQNTAVFAENPAVFVQYP